MLSPDAILYSESVDVEDPHLRSSAGKHTQRNTGDPPLSTQPTAIAHHDPSPSPHSMQGVLAAFLNSREEDAAGFVASFLQLTRNDRVSALAKLEDDQKLPSSVNAAEDGWRRKTHQSEDTPTELHRRLQHHEIKAQQDVCETSQSREVEERIHGRPPFTTHFKKSSTRQWPYSDTTQAAATDAGPSVSAKEDCEGLETLRLEEETRTGNIVAFIEGGVTEVTTSFDNYFESTTPPCILEDEAHVTLPSLSAPGSLPTLDEILGLDGEETQKPAALHLESTVVSPTSAAWDTDRTHHALEHRRPSRSESDSTSVFSGEIVALPGLEDAPEPFDLHYGTRTDSGNAGFLADLKEIIAEEDNCVQPFVLDPFFDYDADVLGEAFRTGDLWSQERGSQ